jgi:DNA-binding phage protein
MHTSKNDQISDLESQTSLNRMFEQDRVRANRIPGVKTVLVVLSAKGIVFDMEGLRQKISLAYPDSIVFYMTTQGKPMGAQAPSQVDLLIDFTGPKQRQSLFFSRRLRRMARVAVGRNAGLFRKKIYDRVLDEKTPTLNLPTEALSREAEVQKAVLALAGIPFVRSGYIPADLAKTIALDLPPMLRL